MVEHDKINFSKLKEAVLSLNTMKFVKPSLRHVGVKRVKLYESFITTVEELSQDQKESLPEVVIDFFNYAINDDDESTSPELNFEEEPVVDNSEPDLEPVVEEIIGDLEPDLEPVVETEVSDPEITPVPGRRRGTPKKSTEKTEPNTSTTPELDKKPVKKVTRLSKIVMSPKVADSKLTITFKEIDVTKTFNLPKIENIPALKAVRKEAMDFASKNGATKGQLCNISKTLNQAGYYSR